MLVKDEKFRNLYRSLILLNSVNKIKNQKKVSELISNKLKFHKSSIKKNFNSLLLYPYVDHERGMLFLVVATAFIKGKVVKIFNRSAEDDIFTFTRNEINDIGFVYLDNLKINKNVNLAGHIGYAENILKNHFQNEELESIRMVNSIDGLRDLNNPDDIWVLFCKGDLHPEKILVKLEELNDGVLSGFILSQPHQDFGINCGDEIEVILKRDDNNNILGIAKFD